MIIRKANHGDIPQILALLEQVGEVHHQARPDLFRAGARKYDAAALARLFTDPARPVFAAMEADHMLGYCFCMLQEIHGDPVRTDYKTLYIDDLCVDEACRGQHVGSQLYHYARSYAQRQGCSSITLNVWANNKNALDFYRSQGLRPQKIGMEAILEEV